MNLVIKSGLITLGIFVGGIYVLSAGANMYNDYMMGKIYTSLPNEDWQKTQSGRYAHSLKYEDKLPSPVPFNISKPNFFTLNSTLQKTSEEYFEHLCKTEAGNYVWKTAEQPTDSVALLRSFELPTYTRMDKYNGIDRSVSVSVEEYLNTREGLESPINFDYFFAMKGNIQEGLRDYRNNNYDFIGSLGRAYNNYQVVFNDNKVVNFKKDYSEVGKSPKREVTISNQISSDYGITWRGFSRPLDREYGIAGGDLILINLKTNEIMAVQRNFAKARISNDKTNWYYPLGCFELYKNDPTNKLIFKESDSFEYKLSQVKTIDNNTVYNPFLHKVLPNIKDMSDPKVPDIANEVYRNIQIRN